MSSVQFQGFPAPQTPITDRMGVLQNIWYQFLASIFRRTGGGGAGDIVMSGAELDPATDEGFMFIPGGAGPPTGTPLDYPGQAALYADLTNNRVYAYLTGVWRALN